jgi:general secretion pathway protein E
MTAWMDALGLAPEQRARARQLAADARIAVSHAARRLAMAEDRALATALAKSHNLPLLDSGALTPAKDLVGAVSPAFLRDIAALPLARDAAGVRVAMASPDDAAALAGLAMAFGAAIHPVVASRAAIEAALARLDATPESPNSDDDDAADTDIPAPAVSAVQDVLAAGLAARASDIHLEPTRQGLRVRLRIDGVLIDQPPQPANLARAIVSRVKILAGLDIAERRKPQDGRARLSVSGRSLDLRIATGPSAHGEGAVIRLLEDKAANVRIDALGLSAAQQALLQMRLAEPYGLILVTGPTGAGKTTTLAAALQHLNQPGRKLISIEDPIEYQIEGATQIAVKPQIGLTFAAALRAVLRHDPDVIVIGELRDAETAEIAINAALTGHLVLATLHANSAAAAAPRLIDMGVDPALLRSTAKLFLAQRLVRLLCAACKRPGPDGFTAVGCAICSGVGYRGRIGLFEALDATPNLLATLRPGVSAQDIHAAAAYPTLADSAAAAIAAGHTSRDEIIRVLGIAP